MFRILLSFLLAIVAPAQVSAQFANSYGTSGFTSGGSGGSVTPTTISGATRAQVPFDTGAVGTNHIISTRIYDFPMQTCTAPQADYANIWVNAAIAGAGQETALGTSTNLKISYLTGVNATQANTAAGYNQSGATLVQVTWSNVVNDSTAAGNIQKLDDTVTPSTLTPKTFAQMQADGGAISGNTLTVPSGYVVTHDPAVGVTLTAQTAYAIQLESDRPVQQTALTAVQVGTTVTITVASTANYRTGNKLNFSGFTPSTYNTTASTPATITVVDGTTLTYQRTAGLGAVTVLGNIQSTKPNTVRSQSTVATNGFGDIQATSTAAASTPNTSTNWSAFNTSITGDNASMEGVARVACTSAAGKKVIALFGDSIAAQVNDANQANPTGSVIKGDQYGATGAFKRAFTLAGYPFYSVAVPGTAANTENSFGGGLVRQYLARGAHGLMVEMVHNDVSAAANGAALIAIEKTYWATLRAAVPTSTRLVAITMSPLTTQVSGSQWNARNAGAQSCTGSFALSGFVYTSWNPYILGTLVPANGDPDAGIDFAQYLSNVGGGGATVPIDCLWVADGTPFFGTGDGTHGTLNTYSAAAVPIAADLPTKFFVNWLLKRDLVPASNDNDPIWLAKAA